MKKKDYEQEKMIITEVESGKTHYHITASEKDSGGCSSVFGLDKKYGYKPKIGDEVVLYSAGGCEIRGMKINGKQIFYKTQKQMDEEHAQWCMNYRKEKEKRFKKEKKLLDEKYNSLPEPFKKRIDFFRNENPDFRVESESYEMFCLTEAVKIANAIKVPEDIEKFKNLQFHEQVEIAGIEDGHSANTFGGACMLAYWLLKDPTKVYKEL